MAVNLAETVNRIKKAGPTNVRAVPMPGQHIHEGKYQVEVNEGGMWVVVAESIPQSTANDLIRQSTNRVICG